MAGPRVSGRRSWPLAMDDLDMAAVAARLGKSKSWLQYRLAEDRARFEPRLQHHHYIGRSPRWEENEYQALRAALIRKPRIQSGPLLPPEKASTEEEPEDRPRPRPPISDGGGVSPSRSGTDLAPPRQATHRPTFQARPREYKASRYGRQLRSGRRAPPKERARNP